MVETSYCRVPVKLIFKFGDVFPYNVYLKLSDSKIVKLSHKDEIIKDTILRYHKEKGVEDIYVLKEDYLQITDYFKNQFENKLFNPETTIEEKVDLLEKSYSMVKDSLVFAGINQQSIELAKKISESTLRLINESKNVFSLLLKFSANCAEEYKKSIVIGYLCSGIIDNFDWKSDSIKQKCSLAALLCDILLSPKEMKEIQKLSLELPLTPAAKITVGTHPQRIIKTLNIETWISKETLAMIEQHHEEQNGTGFPLGLVHTHISQLSAIFIVAMRFADLLIENNFNFQNKDSMLATIRSKYNLGVFKKAVKCLGNLVDAKKSNQL